MTIKIFFTELHKQMKLHPRIMHVFFIGIFLLTWLPYYLTYFPGIVTRDEMLCINQAMGDLPLSNHHPIIFVLYMKIIISVVKMVGGTLNIAVAVATGIQMIFLSHQL